MRSAICCFFAGRSGSARDRSPRLRSTWASRTAALGREARAGMRLRVNPIDCVAHGVCADLLPGWITLDQSGYPILQGPELPPELVEHARRAANHCPVLALRLDPENV